MKRPLLLALAAILLSLPLSAQQRFSAAEQEQISVPTPHLFDRSTAFTINFTHQRAADYSDYSFPLPVGKAELKGGQALEITSTKGDAVKAMFPGTVRLSRKNARYGNTIVIRHDNGLETVYGYNAQNLVKVGQRVRAGQTIAIVGGDDGRTFCLFAIMVNGGWINPTTVVSEKTHKLRKQLIKCTKVGAHVTVTVVKGEKEVEHAGTLDPDAVKDDPFLKSATFCLDLAKIEKEHWSYPLPGSHVISPYGGRRNHSGVDIKTRPNDRVLAAFDGVVTRSGPYFGYGNCIVIRHAYGLETLYSHQSKNFVRAGQKVKAGECIGLTGQTGRATTPHLHFETLLNGHRFNPALLFDHTKRSLRASSVTLYKGGRIK